MSRLIPSARSIAPVAVAALLAAAGASYAAEKLSPIPYENTTLGFYLLRPDEWESVPPQPGEKVRVVKFQSVAANKGYGYIKSELEVLILQRKKSEVEEKHVGGTKSTKYERDDTAFKDWLRDEYMNAKAVEKQFMRHPKIKDILQFETSFGGGGTTVNGIAVVYPTEDRSADVVLHYFCTDSDMKKLKTKVFIPSFASFTWSQKLREKGAKDDEKIRESAESAKTPVEKRKLEMLAQLKDKPGWRVENTPHYVFVYNTDNIGTVRMVMDQIERILPHYLRLFPPTDPDIVNKIAPMVRITKDRDVYMAYGAPGGSAGYWSSYHRELVFYDDGSKKAETTLAVMRHEAFHQYIYYSCGSVSPHSWFNEGYGDYFAGCELAGNKLIEKPFTWRMSTIANAARADKHVRLKDIVSYEQSQYYAQAGLCYAEGWSIIYFLNQGPRSRNVARRFKPEWRGILARYFETLKKEWGDPSESEDEGDGPPAPPPAPPGDPDEPPAPGGGDPPADGGDKPKPGDGGGDTPPAPGGQDPPPPGGDKPPAPGGSPGQPGQPGAGGDGGEPPKPKPRRPTDYMSRFKNARAKAVEAAFPDWTDEQWDEFEAVWLEFVKGNFK